MGHASFTYIRKTGGIANELNLNTLSAQRSLTSEIPNARPFRQHFFRTVSSTLAHAPTIIVSIDLATPLDDKVGSTLPEKPCFEVQDQQFDVNH